MTRSPLAYPLNRTADMDAGGAADLQTDIMRFMAILSLCLVAIFALVQSIPLRPAEPIDSTQAEAGAAPSDAVVLPADKDPSEPAPPVQSPAAAQDDPAVTLTRPKWEPKFVPRRAAADPVPAATNPQPVESTARPIEPLTDPPRSADVEPDGFTLRFESDAALTRLVAASRIGLYAVGANRAQRMTVNESRISFWDASVPNSFHEMETETVPAAVIDALARSGTATGSVSWGVTLPSRLKAKLDELMLEHSGGTLIIVATGDIRWEAS